MPQFHRLQRGVSEVLPPKVNVKIKKPHVSIIPVPGHRPMLASENVSWCPPQGGIVSPPQLVSIDVTLLGNVIRLRSLGWVLIQYDGVLIRRRKCYLNKDQVAQGRPVDGVPWMESWIEPSGWRLNRVM
jgi:hypothetical protein